MSILFEGKTIGELIDLGWIIVVDEGTDDIAGVRSVIGNWRTLTWSEQTYYRAKYGFSSNGVLDIEVQEPSLNISKPGYFFRLLSCSEIVVPEAKVPGSNDRLRNILSQDRKAAEELLHSRGLRHTGPDGTAILTDEHLWGLPHPDYGDEIIQDHSCIWEDSLATWIPEAPWWAVGPCAADMGHFP